MPIRSAPFPIFDSRNSLKRTDEPVSADRAGSSRSRHPTVGDHPLPNPHLEPLRAMRRELDVGQTHCLEVLETLQERLQSNLSNAELLGMNPAFSKLRKVETTLQRKASFMLAAPIMGHIYDAVGDLFQSEKVSLPASERRMLTAQLTGLRQVVAYNNGNAIHAARSGKRFCPLTLRADGFAAFLVQQEPRLHALVGACRLDGPARTEALSTTLLGLAQAYLKHARTIPSGQPPGYAFKFQERDFGHAPVSLAIAPQQQSVSTLHETLDGDSAVIVIGVDALQTARTDPARGSLVNQMHMMGFEEHELAQRQAVVLLQKLFLELAHVEKTVYLGRRLSKDGSGLTACARATRQEQDYTGSVQFCDSLVALNDGAYDPEGGQRKLAGETIAVVAAMAREHRQNHGESIVNDPELEAWLVGPAAHGDLAALERPASRLQLAALPEVARLLRGTEVFANRIEATTSRPDAGREVDRMAGAATAVTAAGRTAVAVGVTADPAGSPQPDSRVPPA